MPIVRIDLLAGRTPERKFALLQQVTDAVISALDVRPEQVRVLINEIQPEHWAVGGKTLAPPAPEKPAE